MPNTGKEAEVNKLAQSLAKLVEIFRQGGKASDFKWWNENSPRSIFYPLYGYQDGQPLFESVVQGVLSLNSEMLSEHGVHKRLMYDFLQTQTIDYKSAEHLYNENLVSEARRHLNELIKFKACHDVHIPITNLWHRGQPITFFGITFIEFTRDLSDKWKKGLKTMWTEEANTSVHVLAKINVTGDEKRAYTQALTQVREAFDIFRAFCFPFGKYSLDWHMGVVGDMLSYHNIPISIDSKRFFSYHDIGNVQVELSNHIMNKYSPSMWDLIYEITINKRQPKRLCDSIHWLAEATKPDTNNAKFLKISIALETLLGKEPKDEDLKVRSITAMLAERAVFLAGKDLNDRLTIDQKVRLFYGKRSEIVHGEGKEVSSRDIDEFGELVRRISLAIINELNIKKEYIDNINELERWIKKQKYTLHENKEVS